MSRLRKSPLAAILALLLSVGVALGAGVVLNPSKTDVNLNGHNLNAAGGSITNLSGSSLIGHNPPYVLGEGGALIPSPNYANSNFVIAGGSGNIGAAGGDYLAPAVNNGLAPIISNAVTYSASSFPRQPNLRWLDRSNFILTYTLLANPGSLPGNGQDDTGQYIAAQRGHVNSDGSLSLKDPVPAVTESDYSSTNNGHHAIAEQQMGVDAAGNIWILYSRFLSGAGGTGVNTQTNRGVGYWWTKSADGGKTWAAPTDVTSLIMNATLTNITANIATGGGGITAWGTSGSNRTITLGAAQSNWAVGWAVKLTGVTDSGGSAVNNNVYRIAVKTDTTHFTLSNVDGSTMGTTGTPSGGTATPVPMYGYVGAGHAGLRQDGTLDFVGTYRYPADTSGTSYPFIANTANMTAFTILQPVDETDSVITTNPSTEGVAVETSPPGSLAIFGRSLGAGANAGHVMHHLIAGDTALKNHVFLGTQASNQGAIDKLGDGSLVACYTDNANRYRLTVARMTANGQVINNQRRVIHYGSSCYSDVAVNPDGEQILVAYESGEVSTQSGPYIGQIRLARLTVQSLINASGTLDEFDYDLDECPAGVPAPVVSGSEASCLYDRGNLGQNATLYGAPTYVIGNGIAFHTATTDHAQLAGANDPAFAFDILSQDSGKFEVEFGFKTTAANQYFLGNATQATKGWCVVMFNGNVELSVGDGTLSVLAVTTSGNYNDGKFHKVVARRTLSANPEILVDGVRFVASNEVSSATGAITSGHATTLNQAYDGSSAPGVDVTYYGPLRVVRGIPSASFATSYTPPAKPYLSPTTTPPVNSALKQFGANPNLKLLLFDSTGFGNRNFFNDVPGPQPPTFGYPFSSPISSDASRYFCTSGVNPSQGNWRCDPYLGWCVRVPPVAAYIFSLDARTNTAFDFIQTTENWTLGFKVIFHSHAVLARLFDMTSFGVNNGLLLYRNTSGAAVAFVNAGGGNKLNETLAGTITDGSPYELVFSGGNASGQKLTYYIIPLSPSNNSAPTISTYKAQSTGTIATAAGSAGQALQMLNNCDVSISDLWLVNDVEANLRTQIANLCIAP